MRSLHMLGRPEALTPDMSTFALGSGRVMAVLRLPLVGVIGLIGLAVPRETSQPGAFLVVWVAFLCWSVLLLWWLLRRPVGGWSSWLSTFVDLAALVLLAAFSSGPTSYLGPVFYLYPIAVAFQYRPRLTATVGFLIAGAYVVSWLPHLGRAGGPAVPLVVWLYGGLLIWLASASTALTVFLVQRSRYVLELLQVQRQLTAETLAAAARERARVAEDLHDGPLQDLIAVRRHLEELADDLPDNPLLARSDALLAEVSGALRGTVSVLHPQVLDARGLSRSLEELARRPRRVVVHTALDEVDRADGADVVRGALRELLSNVDRHSRATTAWVQLQRSGELLTLVVEDDGIGVDQDSLPRHTAAGHIGLAAYAVKVRELGGTMRVGTRPGGGARISVSVPQEVPATGSGAPNAPARAAASSTLA